MSCIISEYGAVHFHGASRYVSTVALQGQTDHQLSIFIRHTSLPPAFCTHGTFNQSSPLFYSQQSF